MKGTNKRDSFSIDMGEKVKNILIARFKDNTPEDRTYGLLKTNIG